MNPTELAPQEPEFTADPKALANLAADQSALVSYLPKSQAPFKLNTLIPRNMAFEAQKALNRIVKEKGNIDNYVRNALQYSSTAALWKGLGAEQVDGVALYIKQFEREQGLIIADQTGIGKGRQAAAVIRHAIVNGYLPIFFTKSPSLYTDMYRDLKAIGFQDMHPFIVNTDSQAKVKDSQGSVVFSPLQGAAQQDLLTYQETHPIDSPEAIDYLKQTRQSMPDPEQTPTLTITRSVDYMPEGYNMVFSTYSQIQSAAPFKREWIENLCNGGIKGSTQYKKVIFILDESHCAGGYDSIVGKWMRRVLPQTHSCCFLSATFAKYPEVMPFYGKKTAISETNLTDERFVYAMKRGGLALQEVVASNLAESGQLIRRQRSNAGIAVHYEVLDKEPNASKDRQSVNRIIALMKRVIAFEMDYIQPIRDAVHSKVKDEGGKMDKSIKGLGIKKSPYFSRVFGILDQMLFSLKVKAVAEKTIGLLQEDKKVVIAFKSTMGMVLKDMNLSSGDQIDKADQDFARTLVKGLDSVLSYNFTDLFGEKSKMHISIDELSVEGRQTYHQIKKDMQMEASGLSISPIDQLTHLIEQTKKSKGLGGHASSHFKVAEVTGRNQKLVYRGDKTIVSSFRSDTEKAFRLFNSGEYDVLLINQSGSTGASAHASKDFSDQRVRAMLIHQFELDINIEVQKRGRINRTGQVNLPEYYYITTAIPTEARLMTMLKSKLKVLDANTTGSQRTNDDTLKSADFLNKYGDTVAWDWIDDNKHRMEELGYPTYHRVTEKKTGNKYWERNDSKEGAIRQLTGRAGILRVEEQESLYKELLERYGYQIKLEKEQGTYDLEVEFLPLDAQIEKRFVYARGKGGHTPFGKDSIREVSIVNNLNRPFTKKEVESRLQKALEGRKPESIQRELVGRIAEEYPKLIASRKEKRSVQLSGLQEELEGLPKRGSGKDALEQEKIAFQYKQLQELIEEKTSDVNELVSEMEYTQSQLEKYTSYFTIGEVVKVSFYDPSKKPSWGIFLGVTIGKTAKNPYTYGNIQLRFIVADSRKLITLSLQPSMQATISKIYTDSMAITDKEQKSVLENWNEHIIKASAKREQRQILTQNIVVVSGAISRENKLIKYNTRAGEIKTGILMHPTFGSQKDLQTLVPISEAYGVISGLEVNQKFTINGEGLRFEQLGTHYFVYIQKGTFYQMVIDPKLRELLRREEGQSADELPDFVQNGGEMMGVLPMGNLQAFLKHLDHYGLQHLTAAQELKDWELENKQEWEQQNRSHTEVYSYELGRPYGQGSNPVIGFKDYIEPKDSPYPFGSISFTRVLSDKEKYNYSLIPIFKSAAQSYGLWKEGIKATPIAALFEKTLKEVERELPYKAIHSLGYFIYNHPHGDGNPEFVFGRYDPEELGREAYQDRITVLTPLDRVVDQLHIYLELQSA